SIRTVAMFNNLISYAGGGAGHPGVVFTGIDRSGVTMDPLSLRFSGNLLSVPIPSMGSAHLPSLMQCQAVPEFGNRIMTEAELNTSEAHRCLVGSAMSWTVAGNAAFTATTGMHSRDVVELDGTGAALDTSRVFVVGEPLSRLPLATDVAIDLLGRARAESSQVGAISPP
ncbi:MAG TPA: hypothetical protein VN914_20410, partial [Polyangia bacterium]|nr:hypothetical protein [Polyangia bacterium]